MEQEVCQKSGSIQIRFQLSFFRPGRVVVFRDGQNHSENTILSFKSKIAKKINFNKLWNQMF